MGLAQLRVSILYRSIPSKRLKMLSLQSSPGKLDFCIDRYNPESKGRSKSSGWQWPQLAFPNILIQHSDQPSGQLSPPGKERISDSRSHWSFREQTRKPGLHRAWLRTAMESLPEGVSTGVGRDARHDSAVPLLETEKVKSQSHNNGYTNACSCIIHDNQPWKQLVAPWDLFYKGIVVMV
jgi:hypothetical protein